MARQGDGPETVGDLQARYNEANPRTISADALSKLGRSLEALGDLSGIVYNRRTDRLVGGHQRTKELPEEATISITARYKNPTDVGTIALGFVSLPSGEKYAYREVDVDERTEAVMMVAANNPSLQGEFVRGSVAALLTEASERDGIDLDLSGFEREAIDRMADFDAGSPPPEFESFDDSEETDYRCPKCGHEWDGEPR